MAVGNNTKLDSLATAIEQALPDAQLSLDAPQNPQGLWFLDIEHAGRHAIVQWQERRGFGVCYGLGECYGEGPDEQFDDESDAANSVLEYLRTGNGSTPDSSGSVAAVQTHVASKGRVNLVLTVVRAADLDRSASFYSALGLKLSKESHGTGPEHYSFEESGHTFEIYPLGNRKSAADSIRIGFAVPEMDQAINRAIHAGGRLKSPPRDSEWGRRAVVIDPDGHVVELTSMS